MGCLPASMQVSLERLFSRIRCIWACCGGKVIVQNSEFCDGQDTKRDLLQPGKRSKLFKPDGCFACCKRKRSQKTKT